MAALLDYGLRVAPALALVAAALVLLRPGKTGRVVLYILTFILMRDALTPAALWELGTTNGVPWIRLFPSRPFLLAMAGASLLAAGALVVLDRANSQGVAFLHRGRAGQGWRAALLGLAVVLAPFWPAYARIALEDRGGPVDPGLLLPLMLFALGGNFLEELLFRGFVYNLLKRRDPDVRAGVASGFVFALCHVFLATTVTAAGAPLLLFTLWEGVICGVVGARHGVLPATIVHGGAIFALAAGLF
ncbi:MAG TPA: CPBP family intramembrane glutamic endopeptidase [Limnochordales bacterium]|nr:CPBP family intramembrane glutamic endopeptidase [Limnochordales bacterium]